MDFYPDFPSKLCTYVMRTAFDIRDRHRADDIMAICQRSSSPIHRFLYSECHSIICIFLYRQRYKTYSALCNIEYVYIRIIYTVNAILLM